MRPLSTRGGTRCVQLEGGVRWGLGFSRTWACGEPGSTRVNGDCTVSAAAIVISSSSNPSTAASTRSLPAMRPGGSAAPRKLRAGPLLSGGWRGQLAHGQVDGELREDRAERENLFVFVRGQRLQLPQRLQRQVHV
jgi:hypothetical protein